MGASELGADYRHARAQLKKEAPPYCALCGLWIDRALPKTDGWSWTADHIIPLMQGGSEGDLSNLQPAHKRCNSKKGAKLPKVTKNSRRW